MGTASLVFGLIAIGAGLWLSVDMIYSFGWQTDEQIADSGLGFLIIVIPLFIVGGLLLRKYDRDKKKEKNS